MSEISRLERITSWQRALNSARRTVGKSPLDKEPSSEWKERMLLAEHSPIRMVEYDWSWKDIKQWVTAHLVRHHEGCEKFVHSQRDDRNQNSVSRDFLSQGSLNDMDMSANAQSLINISRKRLCKHASAETREAWQQVKDEIRKIDPEMAKYMVPECIYRGGFCPEIETCGWYRSQEAQKLLQEYHSIYPERQYTPQYSQK